MVGKEGERENKEVKTLKKYRLRYRERRGYTTGE